MNEWTSCLRKRQGNKVSGQVDKRTSKQVACEKDRITRKVNELHPIKKNLFLCYLVFDTSNLFTRLLIYSSTCSLTTCSPVTLSSLASNSFTRLPVHSSTRPLFCHFIFLPFNFLFIFALSFEK